MTRSELIERVLVRLRKDPLWVEKVPGKASGRQVISKVLAGTISELVEAVQDKIDVQIRDFGTFLVQKQKVSGYDFHNGKPMPTEKKYVLRFRPGKAIIKALEK
jgi:nucleoid DNA-binding protein